MRTADTIGFLLVDCDSPQAGKLSIITLDLRASEGSRMRRASRMTLDRAAGSPELWALGAVAWSRRRAFARRRSSSRARRSSTWSPPAISLHSCPVEDVGDRVVLPGLVDTHVHINEPGRTEWEGFDTATRAAAAGGITTLVDMPLNSSPVTTTAEASGAEARGGPRASSGSIAASTAGVVPGVRGQIGAARAGGRRWVQGVPLPLGDRRVPERDRGRPPRRHARAGPARAAPARPRRADRPRGAAGNSRRRPRRPAAMPAISPRGREPGSTTRSGS